MIRTTLLVLSVASLIACASSASSGGTRRVRDLITREEVASVQVGSAWEVVQSLRPEFLRARGSASMGGTQEFAVVYVDGVRSGGPEALRNVPRDVIEEIRNINGNDATTLY